MSGDRLARIEARAIEVQEWLSANQRGDFNICCQRCNAPFEHEGQAVAAPAEWYGGLAWEAELAGDVLALVEIAKAARSAWDADRRSAGAWTATGEQAVRDLAAALDEIGSALARLDSGAAEEDA